MSQEKALPTVDEPPLVAMVPGTRAGLIVFGGIATLNLTNAVFHLVTARVLGPEEYSQLATLLTLAGLIALPVGATQIALARYVSDAAARESAATVAYLARRSAAIALPVGVALMLALAALSPFLRDALGIHAVAPVLLIALYTLPAVLAPIFWGFAQGLQRFGILAASIAVGSILRVAVVLALVPLGLGVTGATAATLMSGVATLLIPLPLFMHWLRRPRRAAKPPQWREVTAFLGPVAVGTLAITSLTTVDLIAAKLALSEHSAGVYGGASFIGRLLLYLPMTIATVLLPKVTSRVAVAQDTKEILHASLAVTAAFSLVGTALLVALPHLVVRLTFGSEYVSAVPLVGVFGLAMTMYALLNVQLVYHLGHGRTGMAWLLLAAAVAQVLLYIGVHGSTYQLVFMNLATAVAVLIVHELVFERTLLDAAKWGFARVNRWA